MREEDTILTIVISASGKCYLQGDAISLFTLLNKRKKIKIRISNIAKNHVRNVKIQLSGPSEVMSSDKAKNYGTVLAKQYSRLSTFTLLPKKIGNFTLTTTIHSEDNQLLMFPIKVQVMGSLYQETLKEYEKLPMESCTLSVYSKSDVKLFFESGEHLSFLSALSNYPKNFYIIIRNRSANILHNVGVSLNSPPQIIFSDGWKSEDKVDKNQEKRFFFTITPKQTGNFTLYVNLDVVSLSISNSFPFEIRVSNAEYMKKTLENKKLVSEQEQRELKMQIEIEKQLEQEKKLEVEKKKKEKELEIEKKIKERERELKEEERREIEKEKRKKKKEELERKEKEQFYNTILEKITDLNSIYDEIRIDDIEKKLPEVIKNRYQAILKKNLITLIEEMILNADINARIRGDHLIYINKDLIVKSKKQKYQPINDILVSRGGDWKIENTQSVFYYKIKVKNNAKFVLTNVQILLTSIPSGLISQSDKYVIDVLNPDSFESPTFKFSAKESCVGDKVKGVVIYTDPKGNPQTVPIQPFKIKYICNLLVPKPITEEDFERNIPSMHEQKITFDCKLSPDELEPEISKILENNNFYLLDNLQELNTPDFRKLKAYAEGKYDKQDVALSVIMQTLAGQTNKLIVKAMSIKEEKIIDLLRDITLKCDAFKSTPDDLTSLEVTCKNCESVAIITDNMKSKDFIICEDCGEEIEQ